MFTGIVEDIGTIRAMRHERAVVRLDVETAIDLSDTKLGDSIALNGVCLTVTHLEGRHVSFDVGPESLRVTALSRLKTGSRIHLERALRLADRLGGHLVQGHVDGVATLESRGADGDTLKLRFRAPPEVTRLCIHKGSIAIDGVSLTLNSVDEAGLEVWLIPHTLGQTRLGELKVGDPVNVENDLIGKYVERLLKPGASGGVTWDLLAQSGFTSRGH